MLRKVALLDVSTCHLLTGGADLQSTEVINQSLTFIKIIDNLSRKSQYKLHALWCIRKFLNVEKANI